MEKEISGVIPFWDISGSRWMNTSPISALLQKLLMLQSIFKSFSLMFMVNIPIGILGKLVHVKNNSKYIKTFNQFLS